MNIQEAFNFLNFFINKNTGAWFTISELEDITDRGQMSLYEDLQPKYATSQHIKDALSPFKVTENFTTLVSGTLTPAESTYISLLDIQIYFDTNGRRIYYPVDLVNEDERANRLNSQIDPVTTSSPIGEQIGTKTFRFYPAGQYSGNITFLRRPVKPVFGYSVISGRVIVYNPLTSTQLEWGENWINAVLVKALSSVGINLSAQDITQYAEMKTAANYVGVNML